MVVPKDLADERIVLEIVDERVCHRNTHLEKSRGKY